VVSTCFDRARLQSSQKRRVTLTDLKIGEGRAKSFSQRRQAPVWVDLEQVEEKPGPYTMSFAFSVELLSESIRKIGLINPPAVAWNEQGNLEVVSGFRRIQALKSIGESQVLCDDVTSVLSSPLERFLANFYENAATRKFNEIEKAMILQRLQAYVSTEEILASFMPLLSLPSHEGNLKFYLKLMSLEENNQRAIAAEKISLKAVRALFELDEGSCRALFERISVLKLNLNQQIKFIEYLRDISMREDKAISHILLEEPLLEITEGDRSNNPQKAKALLEVLRGRRYPRLGRAQQAVERGIAGISLPPGVTIRYDPYLEDPYYHLEINFKHGKDLKKTIGLLHSLDELEAIVEPWAGQ
jgi:ParB-like chromosome segregation protein Spo0J